MLPLPRPVRLGRAFAAIVLLLVLPTTLSADHIPQVYADLLVFRENTTQSITYTQPGVYRLHAPDTQCTATDVRVHDSVTDAETSHDFAQRVALLPEEGSSPCTVTSSIHWLCSSYQQLSLAPVCPPPQASSNQRT